MSTYEVAEIILKDFPYINKDNKEEYKELLVEILNNSKIIKTNININNAKKKELIKYLIDKGILKEKLLYKEYNKFEINSKDLIDNFFSEKITEDIIDEFYQFLVERKIISGYWTMFFYNLATFNSVAYNLREHILYELSKIEKPFDKVDDFTGDIVTNYILLKAKDIKEIDVKDSKIHECLYYYNLVDNVTCYKVNKEKIDNIKEDIQKNKEADLINGFFEEITFNKTKLEDIEEIDINDESISYNEKQGRFGIKGLIPFLQKIIKKTQNEEEIKKEIIKNIKFNNRLNEKVKEEIEKRIIEITEKKFLKKIKEVNKIENEENELKTSTGLSKDIKEKIKKNKKIINNINDSIKEFNNIINKTVNI